MEIVTITLSILGSSAVYGIIKLIKQFYKNNNYNCKSSCMMAHEPQERDETKED